MGSIPITSSNATKKETPFGLKFYMGRFQSGQMDQTVNLTSTTSVVRIYLFPPRQRVVKTAQKVLFFRSLFVFYQNFTSILFSQFSQLFRGICKFPKFSQPLSPNFFVFFPTLRLALRQSVLILKHFRSGGKWAHCSIDGEVTASTGLALSHQLVYRPLYQPFY